MSSDLRDLYQEVILDHSKRPRNFHAMPSPDRKAEGYNPLCGDRVAVYVSVVDGVVADVAFEGTGCAISTASASLMTEALRGKSVDQAKALCAAFQQMVTASLDTPVAELGKLMALAGVREFPARVKCASLAWHAVRAALDDAPGSPISTE